MTIRVEMALGATAEEITAALEGLVAQDLEQIRVAELAGRPYPPLYASDVRYRREPRGRERWDSIAVIFANGSGDCEDLASARTAQLQRDGEPARAICVRTSRKTFHILVARATGEVEDPSRIMLDKEQTMKQAKPRICIRDLGTHYIGALDLPLTSGQRLQAAEIGFDPWSALQKVMHTISAIVSNPAVASVLPPQAVLAITIADKIASMSPAGLKALIEHPAASPAQKKLAGTVIAAKEKAQKEQEVGFGFGDILAAAVSPVMWPITAARAAADAARSANAALHARSGSTAPTGGGGVRVINRTINPEARARRAAGMPSPGMQQQPVPTDPYGNPLVDPYGNPLPSMYPMPPQYPQYPMPMPPMGSPPFNPYQPYPMPPQYPQYPPGWEGAFGQPQPLSLDEAAAVALWGAQDFAAGSFPGYAGQQPGPQPGYSQGYPGVPGYYQPPYW